MLVLVQMREHPNEKTRMAKQNNSRNISVYAHWSGMEDPLLMGVLHSDRLKGKEVFSFEYIDEWLAKYKSWRHFIIDSYHFRLLEMVESIDGLAFVKLVAWPPLPALLAKTLLTIVLSSSISSFIMVCKFQLLYRVL